MKTITRSIIALTLLLQLAGCIGKPNDAPLTDCPANTECEYTFSNYAPVIPTASTTVAQQESVLMFSYKQTKLNTCGMQNIFQFKAPASASSFELTTADITTSSSYNLMCICCSVVPVKPLSGHISGKKMSNDKWLIDAEVVLAYDNNKPMDTLKVKQYFMRK